MFNWGAFVELLCSHSAPCVPNSSGGSAYQQGCPAPSYDILVCINEVVVFMGFLPNQLGYLWSSAVLLPEFSQDMLRWKKMMNEHSQRYC